LCRLFLLPQILKQFDRVRGVPAVVIVGERENLQDFFVGDHRLEYLDPVLQVVSSVIFPHIDLVDGET
jgi:hypothetical protein